MAKLLAGLALCSTYPIIMEYSQIDYDVSCICIKNKPLHYYLHIGVTYANFHDYFAQNDGPSISTIVALSEVNR